MIESPNALSESAANGSCSGAQRLPLASRFRPGVLAGGAVVLVAAAVFVTASALPTVAARLGMGCSRWVVVAAGLELLSGAGFVVPSS